MLKKLYKSNTIQLVLFALSLVLMAFVDSTNYIPYFYTLACLLLFCRFVTDREYKKLLFYFNFYFIVAIIFNYIFREQVPLYLGMTGQEGYGGTDDCRFYAQVVSGKDIQYLIKVSTTFISPYARLLKLICLYEIHTPLNVLTPTLIFTALLPYYYEKLADSMFADEKVSNRTALLVFLCPFTMYFGCIIMRDVFTAMLVGAGLYYYRREKYVYLAICIILVAFVRFGTVAFLIGGIIILNKEKWKNKYGSNTRFYLALAILIGIFIASYSFLQSISAGKLSDSFVRDTEGHFFENSTIGVITKLPFPLNVIGGTIFFFFIPFLSFGAFHMQYGRFLISSFFQGLFTPIFMFFLWKPIFNSLLSANKIKQQSLNTLIYWVIFFCFLLGTISLQSRHKTVLFPMLCMLAAYGKYHGLRSTRQTSGLIAFVLITFQLISSYLKLL